MKLQSLLGCELMTASRAFKHHGVVIMEAVVVVVVVVVIMIDSIDRRRRESLENEKHPSVTNACCYLVNKTQ